MTTATAPPTNFVEAQAALSASLPGYTERPQQIRLATAVERALGEGQHFLGEAGCGTGKSLGYLIPAIVSGKRVVVSTATKALQDQIAGKDLPFLAEHLGVPFTYALLKGRSNYACVAKMNDADAQAEAPVLVKMLGISQNRGDDPTFLGERDDFDVEDSEWRKATTSSEECPGKRDCPFASSCFAEKAKERAKAADVVVVNHALYLTDLRLRTETDGLASMLDAHDAVIFDEAHEIEEYAGTVFGSSFTEAGVRNLLGECRNFARRYLRDTEAEATIGAAIAGVETAMAALWMVLKPGTIREATLLEAADQFVDFTNALGDLNDAIKSRTLLEEVATVDLDKARDKKNRLQKKTRAQFDRFQVIVTGAFTDYVRWVEEETLRRGDKRRVIKVAPVSVAEILKRDLFENEEEDVTAILTSATLSVGGKFDYIASRLGVSDFSSDDVGTPFDYATQSALYVPKDLPDPGKEREAWASMAVFEMGELVKASQGRALLLFTSTKAMREAYETLSTRLPYTCLMQGQAPNKVLAERFAAETSSVLFATRSFMTGFDAQGETLSLVVIDKLPFPVPTEPLTEARCNLIKEQGGSDFSGYTIPVMTLVLKQAFGRLIRHRDDRGVVAILDPRLETKGYGRGILHSLPPAQRLSSLDAVKATFARIEADRASQ